VPEWPKPGQRWGRVGWRACRVAAVQIGESAEDRSWDGVEERADEGTGLPWAMVEGNRAGVHHAGSGNPLPIVKVLLRLTGDEASTAG